MLRQDVAIEPECRGDVLVAEAALHDLGVFAVGEEERFIRVAEVV